MKKTNVHKMFTTFTLEIKLQTECFQWHWTEYPQHRRTLFHVPNGGKRNKREAATLKASGVVPGVPDLVLARGGRVVFFELKTDKGKPSPQQLKVIATLKQNGFPVYLIRSLAQFQTIYIFETMYKNENEIIERIQEKSAIQFFGLTRDALEYEFSIWRFIFDMDAPTEIQLSKLCRPENKEKFVNCVKKFILLEIDIANKFELSFSNDFEAIKKKPFDFVGEFTKEPEQ